MSRPSRLPVVAVGIVLAVLVVVGCGTRERSAPGRESVAKPAKAAPTNEEAPTDGGPLFAHWPKEGFQGAILISGEQNGYLEPCGCTAGQRGGLARRLDLVERLRKQGWNLALIDLGSIINDPNLMGGPIETRIRYTMALKALDLIGYHALALSPTDLKLGVGEVLTDYMNQLGERLKVVSANVVPDPGLQLEKNVVRAVRISAGDARIGVTSVIEPDRLAALADPDKDVMLSSKPADSVLPDLLAELERDTSLQILLVQGSREYARQLALTHPGFEVVVATSQFVEPPRDAEILNGGKTRLISVGQKGQYVGVLGVYDKPGDSLRYQRVDLNQRYNGKTEAMRKLVDEDFQDALEVANVLVDFPRRDFVSAGSTPTGAAFVAAETCKNCHPNTYAKWASTKHAHAYESLSADPKRNRTFDAHCVSCHTTGFEYNGGFVTADTTPHLKGNQCENCHGPGSQHISNPLNTSFRQAMYRSAEDFDKNQRCITCHSEDDSPHFDFKAYWPQIIHNDLDTYTDPKVHQGLDPQRIARQDQPGH